MSKKEIYNIELPSEGTQRSSRNAGADKGKSVNSNRNNSRNGKKMTRSQMRRKKRKKMLIIEVIVLILVLLFLFIWLKLGKISWDDLKNLRMNKLDDETAELLEGYTNIALFGIDNRSSGNYDSGNSDSIMVCSINNETKEVKLLSVYRDTCMDVDGNGNLRKCNYAYNHGGPEQAIEMLNRNLDLNIQKYVSVDFKALAEAVDALGGIELDISSEEAYYMNGPQGYIAETAAHIGGNAENVSVGPQRVNGVQAVAYCRIRYTSGGDFSRAERQRKVLQSMVNELDGASIGEMNDMVNAVFDDIGTNFKLNQLIAMAAYVKDYKLVETHGFPYNMVTGNYGQQGSLVVPCTLKSNVEQLHADLFGNEEMEVSKEVLRISDEIQSFTGCGEDAAVDYGY